jgi:hypothetical protein
MDVKTLKGEELAKILGEQYQLLMQSQQNILAINAELKRREEEKPKE